MRGYLKPAEIIYQCTPCYSLRGVNEHETECRSCRKLFGIHYNQIRALAFVYPESDVISTVHLHLDIDSRVGAA